MPAPSFFDEMDALGEGGTSRKMVVCLCARKRSCPFSFHCLARFALQGREGIRAGSSRLRSSYGHKEVRYSKFLLRLLLVIGLEAAGDAFLLV